MGIIDAIKKTAGNVARGAARIATGKSSKPAHTQTTYEKTETLPSGETKHVVSDQPIPEKFTDKVARKVEGHNGLAKTVLGEKSNAVVPAQSHTPANPPSMISRARQKLKDATKKKYTQPAGTQDAELRDYVPKAEKASSSSFFKKAGQAIIQKGTQAAQYVKKEAPAVWAKAQKADKTTIRQNMAAGGNLYIRAFTGQDPAKQYLKIQKKREKIKEKKIDLGRKISKKEAATLQKKYGKNWKMAVLQDKQGNMFASSRDINMIRRENALDRTSVNFGSAFPEPNQFISSEFSRQPFVPRSTDPFDIEANFMGERGSGFTSKKRDPFTIRGLKL